MPPSGNGKYIVIALLLLGVIGGVAYWKLSQQPPPPPVTINVPDAGPPPPPTRNPDDEVPPPPPVEDAGSDAGKKTVVVVQAGNQCDVKKCGGSNSSDLETALSFRAKQAHRCYDNALAQDPTLRGKVAIAVRVGANGQACSAAVAANDLGNGNVANCVAGYFRGQSFPAPRGGCVDVNIPINFVPRQ
ncbi:MAG: AgmX/PglI C-terminal domain-containing protein [Labilithrix sp.]|nr:AgmX/PglI C-terminal domain-containing protein [Labilithrix sp.]